MILLRATMVVFCLLTASTNAISANTGPEPEACINARKTGENSAGAICEKTLAEALQAGHSATARDALFQLAIIARHQGQYAVAEERYEQIERQTQSADDWPVHYRLARGRGILAHLQDQPARALTLFRGAMAIASEHDDQRRVAQSLNDLGNAYRHINANREALASFTRSLAIKREQGDPQLGSTLNNIANVLTDLDDYTTAADYYQQALQRHRANNADYHEAHTVENLARLDRLRGYPGQALQQLASAFQQFTAIEALPDQARVATRMAAIHLNEGRTEQAAEWLERAERIVSGNNLHLPPEWLLTEAARLAASGQHQAALSLLRDRAENADHWPAEQRIARLEQLAELARRTGDLENALAYQQAFAETSLAQANALRDQQLIRDRVLFEVAEQQRSLERLQLENERQQLAMQAQRARTALVIVSGVLLLIVIIAIAIALQRRRNRLEAKRREALERSVEGYRQAADALRTSREQLQQLLDFNPEALLTLDARNRVVFANVAARQMLGLAQQPIGKHLDELFSPGTEDKLQSGESSFRASTASATELVLSLEVLDMEEELHVLTLREPDQKPSAERLIPQINRHFARMQAFSRILQASLKQGELPEDLRQRWQSVDQEVQALAEQCEPVQAGSHQAFREALCELMQLSLATWEKNTGTTRVDLAQSSGIWRITVDEGRLRTRALDRYLDKMKLPKNPRWREVVRTAYFVLSECPGHNSAELQQRVDEVLEKAHQLGKH